MDCAGEFDSKDIMQSIINSFFKFDLANKAENIKLTLVISYNEIITNRGTGFKLMLK